MKWKRAKWGEPGCKPSGFRRWTRGGGLYGVRLHADTDKIIKEMVAGTGKPASSVIRILIDKALGLESDPRDLATNGETVFINSNGDRQVRPVEGGDEKLEK